MLLFVLMILLELLWAVMLEALASRGLGGLIVFPSRRLGALPRRLRRDLGIVLLGLLVCFSFACRRLLARWATGRMIA